MRASVIGLLSVLVLVLARGGPARAGDPLPPVKDVTVTVLAEAEPTPGTPGPRVLVGVRNDGQGYATFDVVLLDAREGRGVARQRVSLLAPKEQKLVTFKTALPLDRLRGVVLPPEEPEGAARESAERLDLVLEWTEATGRPAGIDPEVWRRARGTVRASALEGGGTRLEIGAEHLLPLGVYTLWWIDGTIAPSGGPLASPPANQVFADGDGRIGVTLTASFGLHEHERVVVAYHADGDAKDISRARIGKAIFAALFANVPRRKRASSEAPAPDLAPLAGPWDVAE